MTKLNVKLLIAKVPSAKDFGLTSAVILNGSLMTVSTYDLPSYVFAELEKAANS